jgi:hypothetical protein
MKAAQCRSGLPSNRGTGQARMLPWIMTPQALERRGRRHRDAVRVAAAG